MYFDYKQGENRICSNNGSIPENRASFCTIHFPEQEQYNGNVFIFRKCSKNRMALVRFSSLKNMEQNFEEIKAYAGFDYYITANTFKKDKRQGKDLLGLNNIVIDID